MYYKIDAMDSWFFRNSAPFDAGISTGTESIFPPFPSVYAGALRNCAIPIFNEERNKNTFSRSLKIGWNGVIADGDIYYFLFLLICILKKVRVKNFRLAKWFYRLLLEAVFPFLIFYTRRRGLESRLSLAEGLIWMRVR